MICFCIIFRDAWLFCDVWAFTSQIDFFGWHKTISIFQPIEKFTLKIKWYARIPTTCYISCMHPLCPDQASVVCARLQTACVVNWHIVLTWSVIFFRLPEWAPFPWWLEKGHGHLTFVTWSRNWLLHTRSACADWKTRSKRATRSVIFCSGWWLTCLSHRKSSLSPRPSGGDWIWREFFFLLHFFK
jgi:hypothetical protein